MKEKILILVVVILAVSLASLGFIYYSKFVKTPAPEPTPTINLGTIEPTLEPTPTQRAGWSTYKNTDLGFEISYPSQFQVVEDKYGWPKAVLLLYKGGQSYDLAVEIWGSQEELIKQYKPLMSNLTVKNVGSKFVSLLNLNFDPEVDEIISTFKTNTP